MSCPRSRVNATVSLQVNAVVSEFTKNENIMNEIANETVKYPTSKQPNPRKFHHNNRCLLPFHKQKISGDKKNLAIVAERNPGTIIKSNDGKFTYQVQQNGALVKVQTPR